MNIISSPLTRKHKHIDEMKQEIVAQVHKSLARSDTSSERTNLSFSDDNAETNNKPYKVEDRNENYSLHNTPSRGPSVDGETQINTKILSLIETEMKRDINKHSHFTDSRPQSLSFYEDEKVPEELSGNLELLSPEERRHYRRRKEYSKMDTEERNVYNVIQDLYSSRDNEEIIGSSSKKSKSRKKRYEDSEMGIGDSREMMIPKEKRKSKKKKRESGSPMNSSSGKRKHRKKDCDYEPKTEITVALDELQDDVFENTHDEQIKHEKISRSPRQSDKVYVQKKNKFEATPRSNYHLNRQTAYDVEEDTKKRFCELYPLQIAIPMQKYWARFSILCHGLLGGIAIGQWVYIISNHNNQDNEFILHYSHYSKIYVWLFYILCVICIIAVLDRYDLAHLNREDIKELIICKRCSFVIVLYVFCLAIHLATTNFDEQITHVDMDICKFNTCNISTRDLTTWNHLSFWRSFLAITSWIIVGLTSDDDNFYIHLKNMEKYLPTDR